MGSKQKRPEGRPDHASKHHHKGPHSAPSSSRSSSVNPIKTKIRDVSRLLERSEILPAGVRIEKERALAGYKQDLEEAYEEKRKQQLISKYHMVRFFGESIDLGTLSQTYSESELMVWLNRTPEGHQKPEEIEKSSR